MATRYIRDKVHRNKNIFKICNNLLSRIYHILYNTFTIYAVTYTFYMQKIYIYMYVYIYIYSRYKIYRYI